MKKLLLLIPLLTIIFQFTSATVMANNYLDESNACKNQDGSPFLNPDGSPQECNPAAGLICKSPANTGEFWTCQKGSSVDKVIGRIEAPDAVSRLGFGADGLSNFFSTAIQLIYIVAGLLFLFMVIISALQWITSGGDKEAVSNARNRLTFAIIGIVILALAFVIINVIGQITGFEFFAGQNRQAYCPNGAIIRNISTGPVCFFDDPDTGGINQPVTYCDNTTQTYDYNYNKCVSK